MTVGAFETLKTVDPLAEKVDATTWFRPLIMVTTEIIAATPTMIPSSVRKVLSLFIDRFSIDRRKMDHTTVKDLTIL